MKSENTTSRSRVVVVGPCALSTRFTWNTAALGDLRGVLGEQAFFGSYHAAPGPFPEAYAAKCAAAMNQDPIVEVYTADHWHLGPLLRRISVPRHWLIGIAEKIGWTMVCAEAHALQLLA